MTEKQFQRKLKKMQKEGERYKQIKEVSDAYAEYFPEKKKRKVSNIMLTASVIAIVSYTLASFWITSISGIGVDPTLTTCFYTFWGSELIALTTLKTSKIIKGTDSQNVMQYDDSAVG